MTTQAEVKRLVKPLLARHSDLALITRSIHVTPIRHVDRGVTIGRLSRKYQFRPSCFFYPMFAPRQFVPINYFHEIKPMPAGTWDMRVDNVQAHLDERLEQIGLPMVRRVETIDDFCNLDVPHTFIFQDWRKDFRLKPFIDAARGDFEPAAELCRQIMPYEKRWREAGFGDLFHALTKVLYPLVADRDAKHLATQLRAWEANSARDSEVENYWEPTPFPFEEEGWVSPASSSPK